MWRRRWNDDEGGFVALLITHHHYLLNRIFRLLFVAPWNFCYDDFREISNLVTDLSQSFLSRLVMTNYLVVMMTDN